MDAYMTGMHTIFVMYAPIIGICFICAVFIKDEGVAEKDAKPTTTAAATNDTSPALTPPVPSTPMKIEQSEVTASGNGVMTSTATMRQDQV